MLPEDERRLQREADIAKAITGPDYSLYNEDLRKEKAYRAKRDAMAREYNKQAQIPPKRGSNSDAIERAAMSNAQYNHAQAGYNLEVRWGRIKGSNGKAPPFRSNPTRPVR